jgi:hypothetical protein
MNLKQLIKFGLENSSDPVIKNPILRDALEPRSMDQAALVDELEPGAFKDEMLGKFDPDQETHEEYLQRINLERPFNMAEGGRIGLVGGGWLWKLLYKGKPGLQEGSIARKLKEKYIKEGMDKWEALRKSGIDASNIVKQKKLKIVQDQMAKTNYSDDTFVDLIDEYYKLTDYEMYKDIKRWDSTRPALADKTRAIVFPDWAEARYGDDYHTVLEKGQTREIQQSINPNIKEPLSPADQMASNIDDMNKANIDELFEGKKKHAIGGRVGYNDGQLVTPSVDGSRPGYGGLPDFITKSGSKTNPYRVKVKKSKLNEPFSGMYPTLKKAKEVVKEKGFKKGKTGVEYPELLEKAKKVVNDFNKIVDSAIANNDLRDVKYLERYVKDRFKKKSEQDQILRQIYKNKIDYRDLTEVRKKVAKNLVNEAMERDEIVLNQFVYDRLGASRAAQLTSDVQQIVNKGLKNQTKIKVDRAIESVVKGDMIIDDSLKKTVGKIIGRTQFGNTEAAWKKAFNENSFYKKNKKLLDYAFTAGAKSSRTPGLSIQEILDDAKYKIDGGVTFSGKQTQFSGLKRYIFDYAKQHWHRNNYNGTPEKSLIEFYDKNGKPIKWKSGLKLNIGEVQFKIPSESDVMWSYNGKPKGSVSVTGPMADGSGIFNEVTDQYNVIKEISDAKVTHPVTGKETTYNNLVKQIYKKYGYTGDNVFGLDVDHFKGVANHPFRNLRAMDRRLNISLGAIDRTFKNRNLKSKLKKELLGDLSTATGSNYSKNLKNYFVNQATNVLEKGYKPTLATESPYYQAVKNVYEQKNLPKTQKDLLEKSYQRAIKVEKILDDFWCGKKQIAKAAKAGGRIGFSGSCPIEVKQKNFIAFNNDVRTGKITGEAAEQIAKKTSDVVTKAGSRSALTKLLGPAGIGLDVIYEVASVGTDIYGGKPWREAIQDNWIAGAFMPGTSQEEFHKSFFKKYPEAKVYGSGLDLEQAYLKQQQKIERLKADTTARGKADAARQLPELERDLEGIVAQYHALGNAMQPGSPEYENYMAAKTEYLDARKAKAPSTAAKLEMKLDPIESDRFKSYEVSSPVKIDFNLPGNYTTFKPDLPPQLGGTLPTTREIDELYAKEGYDLSPQDIDYVQKMEKWKQLFYDPENRGMGIRGTQDWRGVDKLPRKRSILKTNFAGGGIAGIRRPHAIPPKSGPNPQGLPSMLNRVKRI